MVSGDPDPNASPDTYTKAHALSNTHEFYCSASHCPPVRYTPTLEVYGMCRAKFPYSHLENCNLGYDFLMRFWLRHATPRSHSREVVNRRWSRLLRLHGASFRRDAP